MRDVEWRRQVYPFELAASAQYLGIARKRLNVGIGCLWRQYTLADLATTVLSTMPASGGASDLPSRLLQMHRIPADEHNSRLVR